MLLVGQTFLQYNLLVTCTFSSCKSTILQIDSNSDDNRCCVLEQDTLTS